MVSLSIVVECVLHTIGRVTYLMDSKPPLGADSSTFSTSDCSGWVRWALDRAGLTIPDGSYIQHDWCQANLRAVDYQNAATLADPSRLFIAFIAPAGAEPGHVWLLHSDTLGAGMTWECHGGVGVDSRPYNSPALANVCACYEIPCTA